MAQSFDSCLVGISYVGFFLSFHIPFLSNCLFSTSFPVMAKKSKEKSLIREVEEEIHRLSDEHVDKPEDPPDYAVLGEILKQQQQQHKELVSSINNTQASCLAVVSAVKELVQPKLPAPVAPREADAPPPAFDDEYDSSGDEAFDFPGWDLPQSGQVRQISEPIVHQPGTSSAPQADSEASTPRTEAPMVELGDLYNPYIQHPNWNPPEDLLTWLKSIMNSEVPPAAVKEISMFLILFLLFVYTYIYIFLCCFLQGLYSVLYFR